MFQNIKTIFFPHDQKFGHIKSLDGLRGVAVLIVIMAHSFYKNDLHIPFLNFLNYGKIGVYVFFVLSAYLLDKQIINVMTAKKVNKRYWMNYALRRFLRIYPLFFISLMLYYLMNRNIAGNFITSLEDMKEHLLLNKGSFMYWSIPVEFKYYLLSPLLLVLFKKLKWKLKYIFFSYAVLIIGSVGIDAFLNLGRISTFRYLPVFLSGTFIAYLEKFHSNVFTNNITLIGNISLILLIALIPSFWIDYFSLPFEEPILIAPLAVLIGMVLILTLYGWLRSIMEIRILRFIGNISFSLYLCHAGVLILINKYGSNVGWIDSTMYYTFSILIACLSYLLIEYPLSKINIKLFIRKQDDIIKNELLEARIQK